MSVTQAMLMAAGLGTRLMPFTERAPKALLPVLGVPIAQFALDSLARAGVDRVVANVHHHASAAKQGLAQLDRGDADFFVSDESERLLGSAGGIRKALPKFRGQPFFLINADVLCDIDLRELATTHELLRSRWGVTMTLAVFEQGPALGRYRELMADGGTGLITGLGELASQKPFFIGSAVIEPEAFAHFPEGEPGEFVPLALLPAIRAGRAGFHPCAGTWKDIGAPDVWLEAHLHLIQALETGKLHPEWRRRLERRNRRLSQEIWVSTQNRRPARTVDWAGPCYWEGETPDARPPRHLGPGAVLYGENPEGVALERGIGFRGSYWSAPLRQTLSRTPPSIET